MIFQTRKNSSLKRRCSMTDDWSPVFFALCIGIPFIALTVIIAYLLYKIEKYEKKQDLETHDCELNGCDYSWIDYNLFKEFGNDQSHSGAVGFDVDENDGLQSTEK